MNILKLTSVAGLVLGSVAIASSASAAPILFDETFPDQVNNVDNAEATLVDFTLDMPGYFVDDINVELSFNNSFERDMTITLSHLGVTVLLHDEFFSNSNLDLDLIFDDEAATGIPDGDIDGGTFQPDEMLAAFDGLSLSGDWTLTIIDNTGFDGNGNDLTLFRLFGTKDIPEPASLGLLGLGLVGFGLMRRRRKIA